MGKLPLDHILFQFLLLRENATEMKSSSIPMNERDGVTNRIERYFKDVGSKTPIKFNDFERSGIPYLVLESDCSLIVANDTIGNDLNFGKLSPDKLKSAIGLINSRQAILPTKQSYVCR